MCSNDSIFVFMLSNVALLSIVFYFLIFLWICVVYSQSLDTSVSLSHPSLASRIGSNPVYRSDSIKLPAPQ